MDACMSSPAFSPNGNIRTSPTIQGPGNWNPYASKAERQVMTRSHSCVNQHDWHILTALEPSAQM